MMVSERRSHMRRVREIAQIAARYGFAQLLNTPTRHHRDADIMSGTRGQRLRNMLDELGPTFVKFGQMIATRPDVLPADIVAELRLLQDQAAPEPIATIQTVLAQELGHDAQMLFAQFDEVPIASASIGQVHRARLHDGRDVVIKIQRPTAARTIAADIALLRQLAPILHDQVDRLAFIDLDALVDEFAHTIRQELDYGVEGRNIDIFRQRFIGDPHVRIPQVIWDHSTARVLVMDYIDAPTLRQLDIATWPAGDRRQLATRIAETWMQMVFQHGVFHADPHHANIMVISPNIIGLVDFGMIGRLSDTDRDAAIRLLIDLLDQRSDRLPRRLHDLGVRYPREREQELADQLASVVARYGGQAMGDIDARALLGDVFETVYHMHLTLPTRWVLLDKTLATLAGVTLELSPEYNVFASARPYIEGITADRLRPEQLARHAFNDIDASVRRAREYPQLIGDILESVRSGEIMLGIESRQGTVLIDRVERATNRVILAVVAIGLILAASIIGAISRSGTTILGFQVLGFIPAVIGAALIGWILLGIARSGKW
jgi:ubiquinone biosynthesis protein